MNRTANQDRFDDATNLIGAAEDSIGFVMDSRQSDGNLCQALFGIQRLVIDGRELLNKVDVDN